MELSRVTFFEQPKLRQPYLVAAFAGWPDAAQIATGTVSYLINRLDARRFAEIRATEFYDFTAFRPHIAVDHGIMSPLKLPQNSFFYWQNPNGENDLIFLSGMEPQLNWQAYVESIVDLATMLRVSCIYPVGGLFDNIPHTRETKISGLVNDPNLIHILDKHGIEPVTYHGPTSIHGLLLTVCAFRRIPAISLWGHTPLYIRMDSNPIVCYKLLNKLSEILAIQVNQEELKKAAAYLTDTLNRLLTENEQARSYVKTLEDLYDSSGGIPSAAPIENADKIIKEVEDFLRNQRQQ